MAKLGSDMLVIPQDVMQTSATQGAPLGARATTPDGRVYRYAQVGSTTALVAGNVVSGATTAANHLHLTPSVASGTGTFLATLTAGATAVTAGQYSNGFFVVDTGTGGQLGYTYSIVSNTACASSGTTTVTLGEPLNIALTTGASVSLIPNLYSSIVQNPTGFSSVPLGVAVVNASASYYTWVQTRGIASVLSDVSAPSVGGVVTASNVTAGAIAAAGGTTTFLGNAVQAATSAQARSVNLIIE